MGTVNEKVVLDFYLKLAEQDDIDFLKNKEELKRDIIQQIIMLRDSNTIHHKIEVAKRLWKMLFEAAMGHIEPDKRGYDDLFEFFDVYVDFEELIFASDSFYRDHTIHCLWVYFLGEYLYKNKQFSFIIKDMFEEARFIARLKNKMEGLNMPQVFGRTLNTISELEKIVSYEDSIRCLTALTHDLGYPLKKIQKVNHCISKILPYFSISNFNEFDFNFNNTQMPFIDRFLEYISMDLRINFKVSDEESIAMAQRIFQLDENGNAQDLKPEEIKNMSDGELKMLRKMLTPQISLLKDSGKFFRYSSDFEQHEHGIISAFLLMKVLMFFRNMKLAYSNPKDVAFGDVNLYKTFAGTIMLSAIADHTSTGYQIQSINNPSALLTFVDELEEFSRISRANQNRQFINEFCKTDIYPRDNTLHIDFVFDNLEIENLDPEKAFKGRCKKLLSLLNVRQLDKDFRIKLSCIGKLPSNNNTYCLEVSRCYANITVNGIEQDIPKYLDSRQFYTKEGYMS